MSNHVNGQTDTGEAITLVKVMTAKDSEQMWRHVCKESLHSTAADVDATKKKLEASALFQLFSANLPISMDSLLYSLIPI